MRIEVEARVAPISFKKIGKYRHMMVERIEETLRREKQDHQSKVTPGHKMGAIGPIVVSLKA